MYWFVDELCNYSTLSSLLCGLPMDASVDTKTAIACFSLLIQTLSITIIQPYWSLALHRGPDHMGSLFMGRESGHVHFSPATCLTTITKWYGRVIMQRKCPHYLRWFSNIADHEEKVVPLGIGSMQITSNYMEAVGRVSMFLHPPPLLMP